MIAQVERLLQEIKQLLLSPTPENYEAATQKLDVLAVSLHSLTSIYPAGEKFDEPTRSFLSRLPDEIKRVQRLFEGPLEFHRGLNAERVSQLGAYDQYGDVKIIGSQASSPSRAFHL